MIDLLLFIALRRRRNRKRRRSIYIRSIFRRRDALGEMSLVKELVSDDQYHQRYFRMDKENYLFLLESIRAFIKPNRGNHLRPISLEEKLAITLRYLASCNSQVSLAMSYRISPSSISKFLREILKALCKCLKDKYLKPHMSIKWKEEAEKFNSMWQFPNCLGAWDGKHVRILAPAQSGSDFFNYKKFFSIVLLASVSADYKFQLVDFGTPGSLSDSYILNDSPFGRELLSGKFPSPAPCELPGIIGTVPYVFIGDGGFPLKPLLMRPFAREPTLKKDRRLFNYRLSRARRVSENAFGILAARWRIFHVPMNCDLDLAMLVIQCSILLHNFLISKKDFSGVTTDREVNGEFEPGNWRETESSFAALPKLGSNNYATTASKTREKFCEYFSSPIGSLPWQNNIIGRGEFEV